MKRKVLGLLVAVVGLMVVACGSDGSEVNVNEPGTTETLDTESQVPEGDAQEDEIYEGMDMGNPWVDSDKAGVLEATGFDLAAPADATNVAYSYMPSEGMAQLNYTMENAMWVYRVKPTDELEDISGIFCEWNLVAETTVAGMDAIEYSYITGQVDPEVYVDATESTRVLNWYDAQNKVTYSLSVIGADLNGMDTAVYAENLFNQN